jgi:signal transduction histidine kinase
LAIEADHPVVWADKTDIARIWRNLISNAIKYSGEHKSIRVWLRNPGFCESACLPQCTALRSQLPLDIDSGRYIVGFVQDNGPGIAEQDQLQLFTRFFRGWAAGTNIPGTGLGLSLVRDILTAYHGDIIVHSAPNQGTTFCFWLPVEAA